jgi:hypothetical protein
MSTRAFVLWIDNFIVTFIACFLPTPFVSIWQAAQELRVTKFGLSSPPHLSYVHKSQCFNPSPALFANIAALEAEWLKNSVLLLNEIYHELRLSSQTDTRDGTLQTLSHI